MSEETPTPRVPETAASGRGARARVHALVLIAATLAGIYLCYMMTVPFFSSLTWALALTVLFIPLHRFIEAKVKKPNLAAILSVVVVALIVVLPFTFLAQRLVDEAAKGAALLKPYVENGAWKQAIAIHPSIAPISEWLDQHVDVSGMVENAVAWLSNTGAAVVRSSAVQLIGVLLTFYFLFYFLRDRRTALLSMREFSPLSKAETAEIFDRMVATVHATIYGTVVVALVQGFLGGFMFWILGLPAPLLWGVVMGLLAIVPVLGAFIVWIPAAIFLLVQGSWVKALILTVWGAVVVGGIDNLLYPMLVGSKLRFPTIPAFISIVGGLLVFGASGIILGPLALTLTAALVEIWRSRISEPNE